MGAGDQVLHDQSMPTLDDGSSPSDSSAARACGILSRDEGSKGSTSAGRSFLAISMSKAEEEPVRAAMANGWLPTRSPPFKAIGKVLSRICRKRDPQAEVESLGESACSCRRIEYASG